MTNQSESRQRNFEIKKRKEELYQYRVNLETAKNKKAKIGLIWDSWTEFKQWSFILNECNEAEAEAYKLAVEKHDANKRYTNDFQKTYSDGILEFCGKWEYKGRDEQGIIIKHWNENFEE